MSNQCSYDIALKSLSVENPKAEYHFLLDGSYLNGMGDEEFRAGEIDVDVVVKKQGELFLLNIYMEGYVVLTCDRCLDEMEQEIDVEEKIKVKFGDEYSDIDDVIVVAEQLGVLNVAQLMYELICVNIPIQHTHELDECNTEMIEKLSKHNSKIAETEDNNSSKKDGFDPRWEKLKNIFDNNLN